MDNKTETVCVAVVHFADQRYARGYSGCKGFTYKADFEQFVKSWRGRLLDDVLLVLMGGAEARGTLDSVASMPWALNAR